MEEILRETCSIQESIDYLIDLSFQSHVPVSSGSTIQDLLYQAKELIIRVEQIYSYETTLK